MTRKKGSKDLIMIRLPGICTDDGKIVYGRDCLNQKEKVELAWQVISQALDLALPHERSHLDIREWKEDI